MKPKKKSAGRPANNGRGKAENIEAFLTEIRARPLIKPAARRVGISHGNHYEWLRDVPGYRERFAAAREEGLRNVFPVVEDGLLEDAMGRVEYERDIRGNVIWDPVDKDGNLVQRGSPETASWRPATRIVRVTRAQELALKAMAPDKYGDKQKIDHTSGGKPFQLAPIKLDGDREL